MIFLRLKCKISIKVQIGHKGSNESYSFSHLSQFSSIQTLRDKIFCEDRQINYTADTKVTKA